MAIIINRINPPKGYSEQFQYFSVTSELPIDKESQILSNISDFPHLDKIITVKERIDDWLMTVYK